METKLEFLVSAKELEYLKQLASRDESFARLLKNPEVPSGQKPVIRLTRPEAEQLREYLMSRMDKSGFDQNYEPNSEGKILEELTDRFFVR